MFHEIFSNACTGLLLFSNAKLGKNGDPTQPGDGNQKNQSFFLRYWYIILPLLVIALFGGGEEPAPSSSASGSNTAATAVGSGAPAASAGSAGAVATKRRGKRD